MATKAKIDTFANVAAIRVEESSASTQTTFKFAFPFSIMDKMALIISRIEYWFSNPEVLVGAGDIVYMGLTAAATLTTISSQSDPLLIDSISFKYMAMGTPATAKILTQPYIKDFSNIPGGGFLVAPSPLYALVQASSTATAAAGWIKMFYTYTELSTDEYWQLVESRRIISG